MLDLCSFLSSMLEQNQLCLHRVRFPCMHLEVYLLPLCCDSTLILLDWLAMDQYFDDLRDYLDLCRSFSSFWVIHRTNDLRLHDV